jgi:glycerol-3-phosphate dehydrogenase
MQRDINQLAQREFDLLIVGGGIYGATAAREAALAGLSVALIEKNDFASGTSGNSLKIVHGGLRYLQHADLKRMRESIAERRTLLRIAPHLIHPLPCVMPTYGHAIKGPEVMRIAMLMNDILSADRNCGADREHALPMGRVLSRDRFLEIVPHVERNRLNGGAVWYDATMYNSERLALAFVRSAVENGAVVANHLAAESFLSKEGRIVGVRARDTIDGSAVEISARLTLTCAGPWINDLFAKLDGKRPPEQPFSTALNLVVKRRLSDSFAFGVNSKREFKDKDALIKKGSRLLFVVPWRSYTMIGTDHRPWDGKAGEYRVTEADIVNFLRDANDAMPGADIRREEVTYFYGGLLPMSGVNPASGDVSITKHFRIHDHEVEQGIPGLLSVLSVKYTTARGVAEAAVGAACRKLDRRRGGARGRRTHVWGGDVGDFAGFLATQQRERPQGVSEEQMRQLAFNYGTGLGDVLKVAGGRPEWLQAVAGQEAVLRAEVLHAVRHEMALTLADVVLRRTELGSGEYPGEAAAQDVAAIMAGELGWDAGRVELELASLRALYQPA